MDRAPHQDKVVVSLPDAEARGGLLQDLREAGWLFTDVSEYASPTDPENSDDDAEAG